MDKVYLILHKPNTTRHLKTAYTKVKAKYLKVWDIVFYSQTNYSDVAITHT